MNETTHKERRRAPQAIGRSIITISVVAIFNLLFDQWDKTDTLIAVGYVAAHVFIYFNPPEIVVTDICTPQQTWAERFGKWF